MIHLSTAPKSNVKIIAYMNIDNIFDLVVATVLSVSPQIGRIGTK